MFNKKKNNNNNNSVYQEYNNAQQVNNNMQYQNNNLNQQTSNMQYQNNNLNQQYINGYNQSAMNIPDEKPKGKRILKTVMIVTLVLIVISIGGFALVYTGVIKIGYVAPESILLNNNNVGVKKGREFQYDYQVYPEGTTAKNVYYESSDPSVAEVNKYTGYITPIKEGSVDIIIKSAEDGTVIENSILTVTNKKIPITDIKLSSERIVFDLSNKNKSQLLKVTTEPYNATTQNLEFYSSNEDVATVDSSGRVFPVNFGMATITVRTKDGSASSTVEVIVTDSENKKVYFELPDKKKIVFPYAIQLDYNYLKLKYGETRKVGFILLPPDVTEDVVTWISSDPNVATVKDGVVTGVAIGQTTVTARTVNDLVATLDVEVTDEEVAPTEVTFDSGTEELEAGETKVLSPRYDEEATTSDVTWSTSDSDVVSVDTEGNITAVGPGEADVTVTTEDGQRISQKVVVEEKDETNILAPKKSSITIEAGKTESIQIETDSNYTNFIYRSSNELIATVDERGTVMGVKPGNAIIYVSTVGGLSAEISVEVISVSASKLTIVGQNDTVNVGSTLDLECEVYPASANNQNIEWVSSNPEILTVNNGDVTGVSVGEAVVSAKSGNLYDEFTVKVVAKNEKISKIENDVIFQNSILNVAEKSELKKILLYYERIDEKNILFYLNLEKYGFMDFVEDTKTTFEILSQDSTLQNTKVSLMGENESVTSPLAFNYEYTGYGVFTVKPIVTLSTGETIELDISKVTIHELPVDGIQPVTITRADEDAKDFITTASIKLNAGEDGVVSFTEYQEYAKQITDWRSSDSNIASMSSDLTVSGKSKGSAKITGNYKNYTFDVNVLVSGSSNGGGSSGGSSGGNSGGSSDRVVERTETKEFIYGSCYSLCSDGELQKTNIPTNSGNCSSSKPGYIDKANYDYYYTCRSGNVITTYKGRSTGGSNSSLELNFASGATVTGGERVAILIKNWTQLHLKRVKITNTLLSKSVNSTIPRYTFTVPKNGKVSSGTIEFDAVDRNNKHYIKRIVLNVNTPRNDITSITCGKNITMPINSTKKLSCVAFDSNNNRVPLEGGRYESNNSKIVSVDANGNLESKGKKGNATITVTSLGKTTKVKVKVDKLGEYTAIKLELKDKYDYTDTPVTIGYSFESNGAITGDAPSVNFASNDSSIVSIDGGKMRMNGKAGLVTITATAKGDNVKDGEITTSKSFYVERTVPEGQIADLSCPSQLNLKVGEESNISCRYTVEGSSGSYPLDRTQIEGVTCTNPKVVTTSLMGGTTIWGNQAGSATVTIKTKMEASASIKVNVRDVYDSLAISADNSNLFIGGSPATISYTYKKNDKSFKSSKAPLNLTYVVSAGQDLISVTDGRVSVKKNATTGTATVYALYSTPDERGLTSNSISFNINNKDAATPDRIDCNDLTLYEGQSGTLNCMLYYKDTSLMRTTLGTANANFTGPTNGIVTVDGNIVTAPAVVKNENENITVTVSLKGSPNVSTSAHIFLKKKEYTSISCNLSDTLTEGGSTRFLGCTLKDNLGGETGASDVKLTSKSENPKIVTVESAGTALLVKPKKAGTTNITVSYNDKIKATVPVTVNPAPSTLKIVLDSNVLYINGTMETGVKYYEVKAGKEEKINAKSVSLKALGGPGSTPGEGLKINGDTISITSNTMPGSYSLEATYKAEGRTITGRTTIQVVASKTPKSIICNNLYIKVKESATLSCYINYGNGQNVLATTDNAKFSKGDCDPWGLVPNEIARLSGNKIEGKRKGTCTVTVTTKEQNANKKKISANAKITVRGMGEIDYDTVVITKMDTEIAVGASTNVDYKISNSKSSGFLVNNGGTVTSSDPSVATVVARTITAKAVGTTTITVSYGPIKTTKKLTVTSKTSTNSDYNKIEITSMNSSLTVGGTQTISYKLINTSNNKSVENSGATITSNNTNVATVSGRTITAKKAGMATITVKYKDITVSKNLTVNNASQKPSTTSDYKVAITSMNSSLTVGDSQKISYKITGSDGNFVNTGGTVTSSNTKVATVSGRKITAKKAGTTTITVTYKGKTAQKTLTVKAKAAPPAPKKVTCYSYYESKKQITGCDSGRKLYAGKCYKTVSASSKNNCLYDKNMRKKKSRTWVGSSCLNTGSGVAPKAKYVKTGSLKWTNNKSTASSNNRISGSSKKCNNTCTASNCK